MKKLLLFLITSILFFASCSNRNAGLTLDDVASYIQERPDSALAVLNKLPKDKLNTAALKARYSLLNAMALDKNYIDTTDAAVIMPALEYYKKRGTADDKMLSLYYYGRILYNGEDYNKAIIAFSQALEYGNESEDDKYKGRINLAIADTYATSYNTVEELHYISEAEKYFRKSGDVKLIDAGVCRKAMALAKSKKFTEAEELFLSVLNSPDSVIRKIALVNLTCVQVDKTPMNAKSAVEYFNKVLKEGGILNVSRYATYAYALHVAGYPQAAEQILASLDKLGPESKAKTFAWRSAIAIASGDYKQALEYARLTWEYQDSLVVVTLTQSLEKARRDYAVQQAVAVEAKAHNNYLKLSSIIFGLLLVVLITVFVYRSRLVKERNERYRFAEIAYLAKRRLEEAEGDKQTTMEQLSELRSKHAQLYKTLFKHLGELCDAYNYSKESTDSFKIVYNKVKNIVSGIIEDDSGQRKFEDLLDGISDDIMKNFRKDFPAFSEKDYRFVSYLFAGFDATNICLMFDLPSIEAVHSKKYRIKKTIQKSTSELKEKYLEMIG